MLLNLVAQRYLVVKLHFFIELVLTNVNTQVGFENGGAGETLELDLAKELVTVLARFIGHLLHDHVSLDGLAAFALVFEHHNHLVIQTHIFAVSQVLVFRLQKVAIFEVLDALLVGGVLRVKVISFESLVILRVFLF